VRVAWLFGALGARVGESSVGELSSSRVEPRPRVIVAVRVGVERVGERSLARVVLRSRAVCVVWPLVALWVGRVAGVVRSALLSERLLHCVLLATGSAVTV
jgi:hypothetical protein